MNIASILGAKGADVVSVPPEADAREVARTLTRYRVGAAMVRDPDGNVLGIVSERDIVRTFASNAGSIDQVTAEEMMTRALTTVTPRTRIIDALGLMTDRRVRHLPVMEGGRLAGLVSIGDLVKARIEEAEDEAKTLRDYVAAG